MQSGLGSAEPAKSQHLCQFVMRNFIRSLLTSWEGRLVLCNILDSHSMGLINDNTVIDYLQWWKSTTACIQQTAAANGPSAYSEPFIEALGLLCLDQSKWQKIHATYPCLSSLGTKPDFLVQCCAGVRPPENWLHTTRESTYFAHLSAEGQANDFGNNQIKPELARTQRSNRPSGAPVQLKPGASLGIPGGLLWYTDALRSAVAVSLSSSDAADKMRDVLGLVQHRKDKQLVALTFRVRTGIACARPSPMDAGSHLRFRVKPDSQTSNQGYTVDLEAFASGNTNIDGAPEWVTRSLPVKNLTDVKVYHLGKTSITRGDSADDDIKAFSQRVCGGRSWVDIKKAICRILQC